jgi:hypothetical protein
MSSATFDPNKFRVEDLFRAKEGRRQRLAKLPFEEKIKIVEKLQRGVAAAMKNEKLIFDSFLKASPNFAGEPIAEWDVVEDWYGKRGLEPPPYPFDKRPDVIALTASGKRIGIELKSWVNREQITEARKQERIQDNILKAIGEPRNDAKHIREVWLDAEQIKFDAREAAAFREQLLRLIKEVDDRTKQPPVPERFFRDQDDFAKYPLLGKYLKGACFNPRGRRSVKTHWISFPRSPYPSGFYSPNTMRETLKGALLAHKNDERYKDLKTQVGLDEVYLLVHYDFKAFAYNTPFDAPNFGFKEAAQLASNVLDGDGGNFDRVFLFHFLWSKEEAYRIL